MKTEVKKIDSLHRVIDIEIPPQQVNEHLKQIYQQLGKTAKLPGFRIGKVPEDLLEKCYEEEAKEELLHILIPQATQKFIKEKKISLLTLPEISNVKFEKNILKFRISFDVKPQINLKRYKGISVKSKNIKVTDEDIQKVLNRLQEDNAQMVNTEREKARENDYLLCDFECRIDKTVIEKKEKAWLHISDALEIPELKKSLIGIKRGEEINFEVTLNKKVYGGKFDGEKAKFKIKIYEIKYKKLPRIDDEFAKSIGQFSNLSELQEKIKEQLDENNKIIIRKDIESQLINFLLNSCSFPLPNSLVDTEKKALVENVKTKLSSQSYKENEIEEQIKKLDKTISEEAKKKVKLWLILDYIAEQEKIDITQEEINNHIQSIATRTKQTSEAVKKYIKNKGLEKQIYLELRQNKVLQFLLNEAILT